MDRCELFGAAALAFFLPLVDGAQPTAGLRAQAVRMVGEEEREFEFFFPADEEREKKNEWRE